tara:strand:+ start:2604 stop:3050 length:447 start_codon:yes stop_codon:yes gene_type:complete
MIDLQSDEFFMKEALKEALIGMQSEEVPVGAVVVCRGKIIARAHNQVEKLKDPTAHAEMLALTAASNSLGSKYLNECTLYVTLEPCVMCAGATAWSQIGKIVYGASDLERGFARMGKALLHKKTEVIEEILADDCSRLISDFFQQLRR